ncbi:MAG TPA: aldehyde dehydrogenase, partial [Sulfitobacter sp.]|nr:aldehyde dehydrogenase [Sulfitobacter sp.]
MTTVKCISPIDGSVYAERETLSNDAALEAVGRARKAQKAWAARPLQERVDLVMGALKEIENSTDRMTEELAHQMGRPVRYGGEFGGLQERTSHMG